MEFHGIPWAQALENLEKLCTLRCGMRPVFGQMKISVCVCVCSVCVCVSFALVMKRKIANNGN